MQYNYVDMQVTLFACQHNILNIDTGKSHVDKDKMHSTN